MPTDEHGVIGAHRKAERLSYRSHLARKKELRALEEAYERAARQVLTMRAQLLEAQHDRKRAELVWRVKSLAKQTKMLGAFRNDLRAVLRKRSDPPTIINLFIEKLDQSPCARIDWTTFDAGFRSTYPEFQSKLIARFAALTGTEIKVCTLLMLKLNSADIAILLCISKRSIEGHHRRIRKKMGLNRGEDIYVVLATM